jgi:hypothetical protein
LFAINNIPDGRACIYIKPSVYPCQYGELDGMEANNGCPGGKGIAFIEFAALAEVIKV